MDIIQFHKHVGTIGRLYGSSTPCVEHELLHQRSPTLLFLINAVVLLIVARCEQKFTSHLATITRAYISGS